MPVDIERKEAPPVTRRTFVGTGLAGLGLAGAGIAAAADALPVDEALAMAAGARDELVELLSQLIRIRSHTGETAEEAQAVVAACRAALPTCRGAFEVTLDMPGRRSNAGAAPWTAPTTRVLRDAIEGVNGRAPKSYPNHYGGDIRFPIRLLDAPAFGVGSLGGNFYGPNEWVDVDDLVKLVAVLMITVSGWESL